MVPGRPGGHLRHPQGSDSLALQNSVYFQSEPERVGSSAGLLRTFGYMGSMIASSATAASFSQRASTAGMHHLAWITLGAAVLYLLITVSDRSLRRLSVRSTTGETQ